MTRKVKKSPRYEHRHPDNPMLRHLETKTAISIYKDQIPGELRLIALDRARGEDYTVSVPPIRGASNWVQVGPTSIPKGQTLSSYYESFGEKVTTARATGRITSIAIDHDNPDVIYVGAAQGGVWKTCDGGRNWAAKSDYQRSLAIGAIAIDPTNHLVLYAGTGEANYGLDSYYGNGVLKTVDGGETWEIKGEKEFARGRFARIVVNPKNPKIVFAAVKSSSLLNVASGIYRSADGGEKWDLMKNGLPSTVQTGATDIVLNPDNPEIAYAAFLENGIYKTEESSKSNASWKPLYIKDLKDFKVYRIALAISKSSPTHIYTLISSKSRPFNKMYDDPEGDHVEKDENGKPVSESYIIDHFYWSIDGGDNWDRIPLPGLGTNSSPWEKDSIGGQGFYNMNVAVDPATPDIAYLSATSLWKAVRDANTNKWTITDIGKPIHADNHSFAFDPKNTHIIYAGNDGGIYKSTNGGQSWDDVINEGLCITQFEFMSQHPTSDALILVGAQDNGTLQFRNNPAFYWSDDGDGGFVAIDPEQPNNFIHQYTYTTLYRSENSRKRGKWDKIEDGIKDNPSLFYAPFALDQSNSMNIAFGSNMIFLDSKQGKERWTAYSSPIKLDLLSKKETDASGSGQELVSAIKYVSTEPGLIYAGTNYGKVFRITKNGSKWTPNLIHDFLTGIYKSELRPLKIWDIATHPKDNNIIIVVMDDFGSKEKPLSHVWQGMMIGQDGVHFNWTDISPHTSSGEIIDIPVNAIVIDDQKPENIYIGTDVGVFRTTDSGKSWTKFSEGLPNCAINDIYLHNNTRLL